MVAVLSRNLAQPSSPAAVAHKPKALYFGSFANEIAAIHCLHSAEFDLTTSSQVPEFTSLVRNGDFTHVVLDLRDGRLAAKLLLPVLASIKRPHQLIAVTTLDVTETYGLIPRSARILDSAIKEKQLLRLLGLSSVNLKMPAQKPENEFKPAFWNTTTGTVITLLVTALLAAIVTFAVMRLQGGVPGGQAKQAASAQTHEQLVTRYARARGEVQQAKREIRRAQLSIIPQLKQFSEQASQLASQKAKLLKEIAFLNRAERAVVTSRANTLSIASARAKYGRSQLTRQQLQQAALTALAFDERSVTLEQRLKGAQTALQRVENELLRLGGQVAQLKSQAFAEANSKLQNAEQNMQILGEALKQGAS